MLPKRSVLMRLRVYYFDTKQTLCLSLGLPVIRTLNVMVGFLPGSV